jgi:hypothetical protein
MKNTGETENHFAKKYSEHFRSINIVTQIWHLHSIHTVNIFNTVHIIKYRHFMNALHNVLIQKP